MADNSALRISEDFWFEDGDIVLSVTEDNVEHHFRVHRVILTISSPVFRDMLSTPQPSGKNRSHVHLQDDSVEDTTALLGALYHGRKLQVMTFDVALAILRLSHKYQIEGLEQGMKLKLLEDWPLKLSNYTARCIFLGSPKPRVQQALKLIATAQRCQAKELLPVAFYELTCAWATQWRIIAEGLSPDDLKRLCVGRARIEERLRSFAAGSKDELMWKASPPTTVVANRSCSSGCQYLSKERSSISWPICTFLFSNFRAGLAKRMFGGESGLTVLRQISHNDLWEKVCGNCRDWFMSVLENKTDELWENIPADFDLPEIESELYC